MARRGLRLSQLPPMRTLKPKAAKTPAHQMAEDTLRELITARFAVGNRLSTLMLTGMMHCYYA